MKTQLFKIQKHDWHAVVKSKRGKVTRINYYWAKGKRRLMQDLKLESHPGDQIQIFKASYEFREAFEIPKQGKAK